MEEENFLTRFVDTFSTPRMKVARRKLIAAG